MSIDQQVTTRLPGQRGKKAGAAPTRASGWRRHRSVAPAAAAAVVAAVAVAWALGGPTDKDSTDNAARPNIFSSSAEGKLIVAGPSAALPLTDRDWRLDGIVVDRTWLLGTFSGTATVTYTGNAAQAGSAFSVGLYLGDAYTGRLTGTVHGLPSGGHALVRLSSIDQYAPGPYHYAFLDAQ
jgi:hypothetical protein